MPAQSLAELHEQARVNYGIWPLWLLLKRRRIEALLAETGAEHPEIVLLRQAKLPLPDDLTPYTPPTPVELISTGFKFIVAGEGDYRQLACERQLETGDTERCELLRISANNHWYVVYAAKQFNAVMDTESPETIFNAARLWVSFHDGGIPEIRWRPVAEVAPVTGWE